MNKSFIDPFSKYLLSALCIPDTFLGTGDKGVYKIDKLIFPKELISSRRHIVKNEMKQKSHKYTSDSDKCY